MTYTDSITKIQPLMLPLVILINEAVTGPCTANQKILSQGQLRGLTNISLRLIDDMSSEYIELAEACLSLLLSMTEGSEQETLLELTKKIFPSVIVDRLLRLTKKIYIKELIRLGKFEEMAIASLTNYGDDEISNKASTGSEIERKR